MIWQQDKLHTTGLHSIVLHTVDIDGALVERGRIA